MRTEIFVEKLPHGMDLPLPMYGTPASSGVDLMAAIEAPITLQPGERTIVPTGIKMAMQHGLEAQIRSRSGLAAKHGIGVLNAPGTIDSDYRGEIKVILINWGQEDFVIERGMRIAQMVFAHYTPVNWHQVVSLDSDTERGAGGFGSTGMRAAG